MVRVGVAIESAGSSTLDHLVVRDGETSFTVVTLDRMAPREMSKGGKDGTILSKVKTGDAQGASFPAEVQGENGVKVSGDDESPIRLSRFMPEVEGGLDDPVVMNTESPVAGDHARGQVVVPEGKVDGKSGVAFSPGGNRAKHGRSSARPGVEEVARQDQPGSPGGLEQAGNALEILHDRSFGDGNACRPERRFLSQMEVGHHQ